MIIMDLYTSDSSKDIVKKLESKKNMGKKTCRL